MHISKVRIENFKGFQKPFILPLNQGLNILVGNNETGKSTILEAIHLALTGMINGRYLKNDLTEYIFNKKAVGDYIVSLKSDTPLPPPEICIEVFIAGTDLPFFEGDGNSEKVAECGICLKIGLAEKHHPEYEEYVKQENISGLPIEYYEYNWTTCARKSITPRTIPLKSALIDSSQNRYSNGSDVYIAHILRNHLDNDQKNSLSQAHRKLQNIFLSDASVVKVNDVIKGISKKNEKDKLVQLSIDLTSRNAWENSFTTNVENIPFQHIGKGEQSIIKTKLALEHKKSKEANIILIEEPENHLSHGKLNQLIKDIHEKCADKQIIISTHSSFVANKLGLHHLILLDAGKKSLRLNALKESTQKFFEKIPGYNTLRLILCKKAILVEGDCDELVVQKAYLKKHNRLPIEDEIDVISVGTTFLRFLEIAEKTETNVAVVTDNDGSIEAINKKYAEYVGKKKKDNIKICFHAEVDMSDKLIGGEKFNFNTLEPIFLKTNGLEKMNKIFGTENTEDGMLKYMHDHKTDCALKIFDWQEDITFPKYILHAIDE